MVREGISMEKCTDLYRLGHNTLTATRYQDETLGPMSDPTLDPGFLLLHSNAQHHVTSNKIPLTYHVLVHPKSQQGFDQSFVLIASVKHGGSTMMIATSEKAVVKKIMNV